MLKPTTILAAFLALSPAQISALAARAGSEPSVTSSQSFPTDDIELVPGNGPQPVPASGPVPESIKKNGWDVVEYYELDGGTITAYSPEDEEQFNLEMGVDATAEGDIEARARCGGRPENFVRCWTQGNRAPASSCQYLFSQLGTRSSAGEPTLMNVRIPGNVRHICRGDTLGECCTTWGTQGSRAVYGHLAQAVQDTFICIREGIWARVENVIVGGGECTHQCVSRIGGDCPPFAGNV